jgi:two-component system NtrC family sensor kinase
MTLPLRTRLLVGLLFPILLVGIISTFVGARLIGRSLSDQAQHNLQVDINSARLIYRKRLAEALDRVRLATFDPKLRDALSSGQVDGAAAQLEQIRLRSALDVLDLVDPSGRVLARARAASRRGDSLAADPFMQAALDGRDDLAATAVASVDELRQEDPALAERSRIPIAGTAGSSGAPLEEARGLMMKAAAVVRDGSGRPLGLLYGARLLNRDETVVDEIYQTIFKGESYRGRPVGEATLCLQDVRVATVLTLDGHRAFGTRIAPEVRDRLLVDGKPWAGTATVVGARHLAAYEPISDISGKVIGALGLGILESKFTDIREDALVIFLAITLGGALVALVLAGFMARRIAQPVRHLVQGVKSVAGGDFAHQVDTDTSIDEFAQLGTHINRMSSALVERDLKIARQTEERVSRSERLAIVGRLAAGVAHQINNPLGGIMLFSNLLLRKFPDKGIERENLERIAAETKRCQRIVQGLLDFARHREPKMERVAIKDVIDKALQLVEHQAMFLSIQTERRYAEHAPLVRLDVAQMQEVFLNLILNAVEAMNGKGGLTITTEAVDEGQAVRVSIADTGCGIAEDQIERVFEPFFTTKEVGKGTGLGLSISRGIVESHGGTIWAASTKGAGTTFFIRLPAATAGDSSPSGVS